MVAPERKERMGKEREMGAVRARGGEKKDKEKTIASPHARMYACTRVSGGRREVDAAEGREEKGEGTEEDREKGQQKKRRGEEDAESPPPPLTPARAPA